MDNEGQDKAVFDILCKFRVDLRYIKGWGWIPEGYIQRVG